MAKAILLSPIASSALSSFRWPILLRQTGQAHEMSYRMVDVRERGSYHALTGNEHDVPPWSNRSQTLVHRFAQESLDTIPHDSLAKSTTNRKSEPSVILATW